MMETIGYAGWGTRLYCTRTVVLITSSFSRRPPGEPRGLGDPTPRSLNTLEAPILANAVAHPWRPSVANADIAFSPSASFSRSSPGAPGRALGVQGQVGLFREKVLTFKVQHFEPRRQPRQRQGRGRCLRPTGRWVPARVETEQSQRGMFWELPPCPLGETCGNISGSNLGSRGKWEQPEGPPRERGYRSGLCSRHGMPRSRGNGRNADTRVAGLVLRDQKGRDTEKRHHPLFKGIYWSRVHYGQAFF